MANSNAPGPLTAPFGAVEPNVLVAGMQLTVVIWAIVSAFIDDRDNFRAANVRVRALKFRFG